MENINVCWCVFSSLSQGAYVNVVLLSLTLVMEVIVVCFLLSTLGRLPYQLESKSLPFSFPKVKPGAKINSNLLFKQFELGRQTSITRTPYIMANN